MARQLYRVYLYLVSVALLILAAVGLGILLGTLFAYTPLRGAYRVEPGQQELVQSLVFAVTAWVIAAALGALHLRLIRRDIAEYPEASRGGVRSFFLNAAEAGGALVAVFAGAGGFSGLAYADPLTGADSTGAFAAALAALLFVAVLELERRRFRVATRAAKVFERLHMFGVPLVLLLVTILTFWQEAVRTSLAGVLISTNVYSPLDPNACGQLQPGPIEGPCGLPVAGFLWLAVLVPVAAIALYAVAANRDRYSLIRTVTHVGSLAIGVSFLVFGLERGIELLLRGAFGVPVGWSDVAHPWTASYDFIAPLIAGILVVVAYGLWLRAEKADLPTGARITDLVAVATSAVIFAVAFWWGIGSVAYTALRWLSSSTGESFAEQWAFALALTIAGLAYIPLAVYLRLATTEAKYSAPRRGFILALLAGGIITGAVGLTMTLYTFGTYLLGAPLDNWQQTVRAGLAALFVGVILVISYGWVALQERSIGALFRRMREATAKPTPVAAPVAAGETPAVSEAPTPEETAAIEDVLREFEGHRIGLHEASERIQTLTHAGSAK